MVSFEVRVDEGLIMEKFLGASPRCLCGRIEWRTLDECPDCNRPYAGSREYRGERAKGLARSIRTKIESY